MNFKQIIEDSIQNPNYKNIQNLLMTSQSFGDYGLPCFSFSKIYRKSPNDIAKDIQDSISSKYIEKTEIVNGYLNFYLKKEEIIKNVLLNDIPYCSTQNKGKLMCIDYSSINLAKYMHIGHLSTTMIGESIARIYEATGFKVIRMNYIGDYGTPFGKIVTAYKLWGENKDIETLGVDSLQDLYVKFCANEESNPDLMEMAREEFKNIENKTGNSYEIYKKIICVAKKEVQDIISMLGIKFDDWRGESFYSANINKTVEELKEKNLVTLSEGALVCDLNNYNLGVCMIQKKDGTSLYATRDITTAEDRFKEYNYDELIYVTAVQQKQYFASFFKVIELMNKPYKDRLKHVYYGMFSLPDGKIASRKGRQAIVRDILNEALEKADIALRDRDFSVEERNKVKHCVAMGSVIFSVLKNERIKDSVFDLEKALSFDGETSPYMQYTYARCMSILKNASKLDLENVDYDFESLNDNLAFEIVKSLNNYMNIVNLAKDRYEPSVISKYMLDLCALVNKYYHDTKIINNEDLASTKAKLLLIDKTKDIIKQGLKLIVIDTIDKM